MAVEIQTYNDVYLETRKVLRDNGISSYDLEARLMVEHASGKNRAEYISASRAYPPDGKFVKTVLSLIARRLKGEPIAYITGQWEFYSLPIRVSRETLIPRIDTEVLAERAITILRSGASRNPEILDLCCGSGCIGLAIAFNIKTSRVVLADNNAAAVKMARENAALNMLTKRVRASQADALTVPPPLFGKFDMIVCNPPYIPSCDIETLDASVRDYEPREALDGGMDGLEFFRKISVLWKNALNTGGILLFETGISQSDAVCGIMRNAGFREICVTRDYEGVERVVEGRK